MELLPGETLAVINVSAVDSRNVNYVLPVESILVLPGLNWLTAVTVRLPDDAALQGDIAITLSLRGVNSNTSVISIRAP
jgi:hypothetical protein